MYSTIIIIIIIIIIIVLIDSRIKEDWLRSSMRKTIKK